MAGTALAPVAAYCLMARGREGNVMSFGDAFARHLSRRAGLSVDPATFADPGRVGGHLEDLQEFVGALDQVSRDSLDAVVADGIDLTYAADDSGSDIGLPGGPFLAPAAAARQPLSTVLAEAQESYQVALHDTCVDGCAPGV
jgi:hypothetical protein